MRWGGAAWLAAVAAVLLALALRPGALAGLGVVAAVLALAAWWRCTSLRGCLLVTWLVALAPSSVLLGAFAPVSPGAAALTMPLLASSFLGVGLAAWRARGGAVRQAFWVGVSWTATEFLWAWPWLWDSWGLPFLTLGSIWVEGAARQVFAVAGPRGATALLWLVAGGVFACWHAGRAGRHVAIASTLLVVVVATPMPLPAGTGVAAPSAPRASGGRTMLPIRIVQHAPTPVEMAAIRFDPVAEQFHWDLLQIRSDGAADRGRLVVWPEASLPRPWRVGRAAPRGLPAGEDVLFGAAFEQGDTVRNGILLWQDEVLTIVQEKRHLVPWVERGVVRGVVQPPVSWGGVRIASALCFEVLFSKSMRSRAAMGAEVLVVLANDAYAGRGTVPGLHVRAARMRATENGLPVVFVQATGPSAVIDRYGRVVASTRHGLVEMLDVDVVVEGHGTPYRRWGDVVGALAAWSAAAGAAAWAWSRRRPGSKGGEATGVVVR